MGCPQSWLPRQGEGQVAVTCWEETNVKRRAFWGAEVSLPCSAQYGGTCGPFHFGSLSHHLGPPLSIYVTCKVGAEKPICLCATGQLPQTLIRSLWDSGLIDTD